MKIALVHDYLNEFGGAERVLLALSDIYPKAPIYTIYAKSGSHARRKLKNKKIIQSWFSRLPFAHKLISPLRFLIPFIWSSFDFSNYDLVITSASWAVTKGMKRGARTTEVCYLHTPPRYLYGYDTSRDWKSVNAVVKIYAHVVNHFMRIYDFNQAQKVDYFIVNSENVGHRVKKFYRRDYEVIYPPVEIGKTPNTARPLPNTNYYLTGGRLVKAKNFDLIICAAKKTGVRLKVFGKGGEEEKLKKMANDSIEFLGHVTDKELAELYAGAKAFIVAQKDEDFGITPIEAAAAGCPTIAYRAGGYLETVVDGKTGVFFDRPSVDSLAKTIRQFDGSNHNTITVKALRAHAKKFSKKRFIKEVKKFVQENA